MYRTTKVYMHKPNDWEAGWASGESTYFPPMWAGFDSWNQHHIWVEFVVGFYPFPEEFKGLLSATFVNKVGF